MSTSVSTAFELLPLSSLLLKNIASLGFDSMTPIQQESLPLTLAGQDIIAEAKTGSGKTVAFALSLLNRLKPEHFTVQSLIICPTRELAEQVAQSIRQLARLLPNVKVLNLSGGVSMRPQLDSLRHGAHIIVGTPGRILKHLNQKTLVLEYLNTLVLDEADRMLSMGFFDAIKEIIQLCPKSRQTLLFSATYPREIHQIAQQFMRNPARIIIEAQHNDVDIDQLFFEVSAASKKPALLRSLLLHYQPVSALIFCNTKDQTNSLHSFLKDKGFSALALNGDMEQADRDLTMVRFVNQSCSILIATDVAARGLDIKELPLVINYDIAFEHDNHIHRIGRTGRAGAKGLALSLSVPADAERLIAIEAALGQPVNWGNAHDLEEKDCVKPEFSTLMIHAGRRDKMRAGDILGALTKDAGFNAEVIGKITITSVHSYVAIKTQFFDEACNYLQTGTLKGRKVLVRKLV